MTSGLPAFTGPATSTKSAGAKRYKAWNRKTPDKTKFDNLKEDKHSNIWKQGFKAELDHQKLSIKILDQLQDPSKLVIRTLNVTALGAHKHKLSGRARFLLKRENDGLLTAIHQLIQISNT